MSDGNSVTLIGRISTDISFTQKESTDPEGQTRRIERAWFRLAITRNAHRRLKRDDQNRKTYFIEVVCWGADARNLAQYCAKGDELIILNAELQVESRPQMVSGSVQIGNQVIELLQPTQLTVNGKPQYENFTTVMVHPKADLIFSRKALKNQTDATPGVTTGQVNGLLALLTKGLASIQTPPPVSPALPNVAATASPWDDLSI